MDTIEKIKLDAALAMAKLRSGVSLTKDEYEVIRMCNSLHSGKAFNAGIRKKKNHNKNW